MKRSDRPAPTKSVKLAEVGSSVPDPDEKLTVADICRELKIAPSTFYDWRQKRLAPPCLTLPNGQLRVVRRDLDSWLSGRRDAA
ncbi:helix-turn-helix transcriptional regulator [Actinomadura atramentaria]|uniref:helix-turn-helix transcriptional regulator n=1 Tax=Actinomadura atramentaria TaxID=1990 RepID=UPI0003825DE0|nr:helix-turn-helix domain-containing protein [Actinomadura atramentaria]